MPSTPLVASAPRKVRLPPSPAWVLDDLPLGFALLDASLRIVAANGHLCRLLGYRQRELLGRPLTAFATAADAPAMELVLHRTVAGELDQCRQENRWQRKAGLPFWAQITVATTSGATAASGVPARPGREKRARGARAGRGASAGGPPCLLVALEDIEVRKQAENRLYASERQYRVLFEKNLAGVYRTTFDGRFLDCNEAFARIFGFASREEVLRCRAQDFYLAPEHRERWLRDLSGQGALSNHETCLRCKDGRTVWVLANETMLPVAEGQPVIIQGTLIDITSRKAVEEALRQERDFVAAVVDSAGLLVAVLDAEGRIIRFSRGGERVTGFRSVDVVGRPYWEFLLPPARHDQARQFLAEIRAGYRPQRIEADCPTQEGKTRRIAWSLSYMQGESGGLEHIVVTGIDVTEHRRLEGQFRQAQKMDAIGQLAGGIAHDFNNLLTVITGHCDLMLHQPAGEDPARSISARTGKIKAAADRAVALTRQLLAFSRAQTMAPRTLNLNEVIAHSEEMLLPLLGEQVEMRSVLAADLGRVHADPVQLEQVLLNLAINARDAMPGGGHLIIETANVTLDAAYARTRPMVKPGAYVMMAVSDTGAGMDAATQARIFEPFFTTKEQGRGTGLGLATVYGIVKQSEGYIWVYSELGRGTTFKVYLPCLGAAAAATAAPPARSQAAQGRETILLVEDDGEVRVLAREVLESHGYRVLEAENGARALEIAQSAGEPIHLLLTDVVMPGMTGRELAAHVSGLHDGLKVLFASGYTQEALAQHRFLNGGGAFVQKPFNSATLARQVRDALDGTNGQN